MNIEAIESNQIIVDLNVNDMAELDITFDEMDYSNIETRRVIHIILDKARDALNRDIDPTSKLIVEAVPKLSGGCLLFFTILESSSIQKHLQIKKESRELTYEFSSLDNLLDLSKALGKDVPFASQLYKYKNKYRLLIRPDIGFIRKKTLILQFGKLIGDSDYHALHTKEHWDIIIPQNAVEKLSGNFS